MATASGCRDFGDTNDRNWVETATRPDVATSNITAFVWFNETSNTGNECLMGGLSINWDFIETRPNDPATVFGGTSALEGTSTVTVDKWHALAMTYDTATPTRTIYYGNQTGPMASEGSDNQTMDASDGTKVSIGVLQNGAPDFAVDGFIANAMLWEEALTVDQLQEIQWNPFLPPRNPWFHLPLYFDGTTSEFDISGNGRTGTLTSDGVDPKPIVAVDAPPVGFYAMCCQ